MGVEYLSYGWALGSITLLLVVLYFTRVMQPVSSRWETAECEICGQESYIHDTHGVKTCGECAELLPYEMNRITAALTGLPFVKQNR